MRRPKKKQAVWKRRVDLDWRKQVEQADVGHVVQLDIVDLSDEPVEVKEHHSHAAAFSSLEYVWRSRSVASDI